MFDIGFSELLLIAVVALVVLGPERLPRAARLAGLWVRRARAQWYAVKSELEHELAAEELQRSLRETRAAVERSGADVRAEGDALQRDIDDALRGGRTPPPAGAAPRAPAPDHGAITPTAEDPGVDASGDERHGA
jgi:sec-independent protein translocase protein TatB